jgi:mitochondrial fission protein ELM1
MMPRIAWILTEGHAGMESQCRGLSEALGLDPVVKRVRVRPPWDWLSGRLWPRPLAALTRDSDRLEPPWPDIVIGCGNVSAPLAVAIKRASGGATRIVHIQNPKMDPALFDFLVAPRHDRLAGENVFTTRAAVHGVTAEKLATAANAWRAKFASLPRPLVAILIGGPNRRHKMTSEVVERLAAELIALKLKYGAGLAITPSRRTGAVNIATLRERLSGPDVYLWDAEGPNPYLALLALADAIVVTADSVSMTSEACATGKPVYVVELPGRSRRIGQFHEMLRTDGVTRRFAGTLEAWTYAPLDDTERAAAAICARLGWR